MILKKKLSIKLGGKKEQGAREKRTEQGVRWATSLNFASINFQQRRVKLRFIATNGERKFIEQILVPLLPRQNFRQPPLQFVLAIGNVGHHGRLVRLGFR